MSHVLLVDDSAPLRSLARRTLLAAGLDHAFAEPITCHEAENRSGALEAVRREPRIDLVLCDLGLPGRGGHELVRALRRVRPAETFVIVALANVGDLDGAAQALAEGADHVLTRPFSSVDLAAVLDTWRRAHVHVPTSPRAS